MDEPRLDLDAALAFATFAETRNFAAAARRLHISQPALHVKIGKLAARLDLPLYRREGRELTLTRHGEKVAAFGRVIAAQRRELQAELDGSGSALALAAGEGAYLYLLGAGIRSYLGDAGRRLSLLTRDSDGAVAAVRDGHADLGVAPLLRAPPELHAEPLTEVGQMLVVPKRHVLARRRRLGLGDLDGASLIVPPEGGPQREMLEQRLAAAGVAWRPAVEARGWELTIQFVRMGVGLAVVNACCRLPVGLAGIALPELPSLRYHLFRRRARPASAELDRLTMDLRRHAEDWRRGRAAQR